MFPFLVACTSSPRVDIQPLDDAMEAKLQASMEAAHTDSGAPGVALAVHDLQTDRQWVSTTGYADLEAQIPWEPTSPYPIGSVTKTFTTAWILQLYEEGALDLDAPLETYVDHPWSGRGVTVRHLLEHSSGIASYNYVGGFPQSGVYTPDDLIDWAHLHEPDLRFEPGTGFDYTNTGFVLLGLVGESVGGRTAERAFQERFFGPLGLDATSLPPAHPDDLVRGYQGTPLRDTTDDVHPSAAWTAGSVISTPADVATWGDALFSGEVVDAQSLALMQTPILVDGEEVGYGLGLFGGVDADWGASWGHTGGYSGQLSYLYWMEDPDKVVVAMVNTFEADLDDIANAAWIPLLGLE